MEKVKVRNNFLIEYEKLFSEPWCELLKPLFKSNYMFNLMAFITELYNIMPNLIEGKNIIYPYKNRLFENFRACNPNNLKVVILGSEPFDNKNATGIPFANPVNKTIGSLENETVLIERCIRKIMYNNDPSYVFDESFYSWTSQGVFLLDVSSTCEESIINAHSKYWSNFTREVIKLISTEKDNIIFMVWGEQAQYFTRYINTENSHHILRYHHPSKSKNTDWNCPNFQQANLILKKITNGKEMINW
jgi:uracil-DNA glycosylase